MSKNRLSSSATAMRIFSCRLEPECFLMWTLRPAFRHLGNYRCPPHGKEAKTKVHRGFLKVAWRLWDPEGSHGATYLVAW
ncbi:hypothetical protein PpBr36_08642 [Pyricularia pennisetigena]|uniref:hypothetical protein n=1 Tax=Pyricularia pennisetigena TaxID=1578925 RepID=UPI001150EBC5|nr:hypothetical protein PpBr36_08642 [Pyricularia pennisetigena]TLS24774.1 hypothetical protein PpBr36_08642 [Pyricularia pennisetigena]